jgi:hypothetical protein
LSSDALLLLSCMFSSCSTCSAKMDDCIIFCAQTIDTLVILCQVCFASRSAHHFYPPHMIWHSFPAAQIMVLNRHSRRSDTLSHLDFHDSISFLILVYMIKPVRSNQSMDFRISWLAPYWYFSRRTWYLPTFKPQLFSLLPLSTSISLPHAFIHEKTEAYMHIVSLCFEPSCSIWLRHTWTDVDQWYCTSNTYNRNGPGFPMIWYDTQCQ